MLKEIEARGPAPTEAAYARSDLFERRRLMERLGGLPWLRTVYSGHAALMKLGTA